jgi:hypothetical protein
VTEEYNCYKIKQKYTYANNEIRTVLIVFRLVHSTCLCISISFLSQFFCNSGRLADHLSEAHGTHVVGRPHFVNLTSKAYRSYREVVSV